jgi:hypothetical protein
LAFFSSCKATFKVADASAHEAELLVKAYYHLLGRQTLGGDGTCQLGHCIDQAERSVVLGFHFVTFFLHGRQIDTGKVWLETLPSSSRLSIPTGCYDTRETRFVELEFRCNTSLYIRALNHLNGSNFGWLFGKVWFVFRGASEENGNDNYS